MDHVLKKKIDLRKKNEEIRLKKKMDKMIENKNGHQRELFPKNDYLPHNLLCLYICNRPSVFSLQ